MRNLILALSLFFIGCPRTDAAPPVPKARKAAEQPSTQAAEEGTEKEKTQAAQKPAESANTKEKTAPKPKQKPAKDAEPDADPKIDETEFLFVKRTIPKLTIEIPEEGMKVLRAYNYVWRQNSPERIDVKATVREGDKVYTDVAIHLKGSYSFQPIDSRPSLTLNFNKFNKGQKFHGLSKLHLNNGVQDYSSLSEAFARDLFNDLGVPAPRAGHAILTLNGRRMGLYILLEGANKPFLKRHFSSLEGNLYDAGSGGEITKALDVDSGDHPEDRSELDKLAEAAQEPNPAERFKKLEQLLDLDQFLTFIATEVLLVHWDGYATGGPNNYRVFHDAARGKFTFIPGGMDQILRTSSGKLTPHFNGMVARGLITTPEGRRRYLERLAAIAGKEFAPALLLERVERLAVRVRAALAEEPSQLSRFNSGVSYLKSGITSRTEAVARLLQNPPKPVAFDATNTMPLPTWQFKSSNTSPASSRKVILDGREILQVVSRGPGTSGSWRTLLLLEAGRYEFTGRARTENFKANENPVEDPADAKPANLDPDKAPGNAAAKANAAPDGVNLRMSGEKLPKASVSSEWTTVHYEFEVHGIQDVELVCEFRGAQGIGMFDPTSMKLIRRP